MFLQNKTQKGLQYFILGAIIHDEALISSNKRETIIYVLRFTVSKHIVSN